MPQFVECQACARTVNRSLSACPYCGSDPGGDRNDVRAAESAAVPTDQVPSRYRTIQSLGLLLQLLFGLFIVGSVVSVVTAWAYRGLLLDLEAGRALVPSDATLIEDRYIMAAGVTAAAYLAIGVAFLVWFWRAYSNLTALGKHRKRRAGWAIGGWLVPFANLVIPYWIAAEIWRESRLETATDLLGNEPNMEPVISWWALFLITGVVNQIALFTAGDLEGNPGQVAAGVGIDVVGSIVGIAAAMAAMRFVRTATERQERLVAATRVS